MASSASMPGASDSTRAARPLVLVTTVEIGEGQTDKIELRLGDSPKVLITSIGCQLTLQV